MGLILSNLLGTLRETFRVGKGVFDASALTAQRTITLPDADVTIGAEHVRLHKEDGSHVLLALDTNRGVPVVLENGSSSSLPTSGVPYG